MGAVKALYEQDNIADYDLINEYYKWLCDMVNISNGEHSYWNLAKALHKKEFYWFVPNDDNRDTDGRKLRELFEELTNYESYDSIGGPCSMLEMLIGLSRRMTDIMMNSDTDDQVSRWFWEMLKNVGLDAYTDEAYMELHGYEYVDATLDTILERTYKRSGKGGLFPLKQAGKDQRKVELWYQMSSYLVENYYNIDTEVV